MLHTVSPWIFEIKNKRKPYIPENLAPKHDVVIIGGGIAGIATAYFLLTQTKRNVTLFEKHMIASGASGHNAGQLVSYFEKPFEEIIDEYGETLAVKGQNDVTSAWDLLADIKKSLDISVPIHIFRGLSGCMTAKPVYTHLMSRFLRPHITPQETFCFIADDCPFIDQIPSTFNELYTIVPRRTILDLLETNDQRYCAAFTSKKGCTNSAALCEEIVKKLISHYPTRCTIYEQTSISEVILKKVEADIILENRVISANNVILCTNGFRDIKLTNKIGGEINTAFHETVKGKIGFMKAYTFKDDKKPTAISYYTENKNYYFYLTRRPSLVSENDGYNLVAIGGPEYYLPNLHTYHKEKEFPQEILESIDKFIKQTRIDEFKEHYEHSFVWHGLMGYTKKGIRLIGPDKNNPTLLYNLGCNGVGLLPSIFGGKKIADILLGHKQIPSIFDPLI